MKRKVIQIANSTQLVSLPRKWAQKFGIRKGDELEVEEDGNRVLVSVEKEVESKKIEIDATNLGYTARKLIGAAYKAGYDEIKVSFSDSDELIGIQAVINNYFIGFEIVEQGRNFIIAKKISSPIFEELDIIVRRNFLLLLSIARDGFEAVQKKDFNALNNLILMDVSINRFSDFCRRLLNKREGDTRLRRMAPFYFILECVEKIGDSYKKIHQHVLKNRQGLTPVTLKVYSEVNQFLEAFYNLFYKFDIQKVKDFYERRPALEIKLDTLFSKANKYDLYVVIHLKNVIDKLFSMQGPLMTMVL